MIFSFSEFSLDVDVERTKAFYETELTLGEGCKCDYCLNFEKAVDTLPIEVTSLFSQMGVDMKKFSEVFENCTNEDNTIFYGGFTHICGRVIDGKSAWIPASEDLYHLEELEMHSITKDFKISFNENITSFNRNLPLPVIQLEISANIPWVLEKPLDF